MKETIRLYALQQAPVPELLERDGVVFSKPEYVSRKYGESAQVFLNNYSWFVNEARKIVPPPEGAEYPYWAFRDLYNIDSADASAEDGFMTLDVPLDMAVFFDAADWNRIMQFRYLGTDEEERAFNKELQAYGVTAFKAMTTQYYPDIRMKITDSWKRLFVHDEEVRAGDYSGCPGGVQAGLWCIRREWLSK